MGHGEVGWVGVWPFILTMGTQMGYAQRLPMVHLSRCHRLLAAIEQGRIDEADLAQFEERDEVFPYVEPGLTAG